MFLPKPTKVVACIYVLDYFFIEHNSFSPQMDSLPQQQRSEQFEKLKQFKTMLERMMQFLSVSKSSIMPPLKNKVAIYEKQIIDFVTAHRPRKPVQQGQLPQPQMQPVKQQSSQNGNHSHDRQANP